MKAYTYIKCAGMKTFKACNINDGVRDNRLIHATIIEVTEGNKIKLQRLADMNKDINLIVQLRVGNKIYFETK